MGLPIAGQMWLEIGLFAGAALVVGLLGAVPVASHAIALQVSAASWTPPRTRPRTRSSAVGDCRDGWLRADVEKLAVVVGATRRLCAYAAAARPLSQTKRFML